MDPFSSALGGAQVLLYCIRHAKELADLYHSFAEIEQDLTEISIQLEGTCLKIEFQLKFLKGIWNGLPNSFQLHQAKALSILEKKLKAAQDDVSSLTIGETKAGNYMVQLFRGEKGIFKRLKYVTWARLRLNDTIRDLDKWWREFDMLWYMIARMSSPTLGNLIEAQSPHQLDSHQSGTTTVVRELTRMRHAVNDQPYELPNDQLPLTMTSGDDNSSQNGLRFSSAFLTVNPTANETLLLDATLKNTINDNEATRKDVEKIAAVLHAIVPDRFGLLCCRGIFRSIVSQPNNISEMQYRLAFHLPSDYQNPRSLRDVLIHGQAYTLNQRLQLARQMARAVMHVHSSLFVHKNIRPETIIVLEEKKNNEKKWPFLIGFERFRLADGKTLRGGDDNWQKNLYRHPNRQGVRPDEDYIMQHDIYSLGVNLLEIGLWRSFLEWSDNTQSFTPYPELELDITADFKKLRDRTAKTKKKMVNMAREILPRSMGDIYAGVVLTCLTCLDTTNNTFGDADELDDDDGVLVGIQYIEKIWTELQKISM